MTWLGSFFRFSTKADLISVKRAICDDADLFIVEAGYGGPEPTATSLACSTPLWASDIKQFDSVLPPCPMNFRQSVIPPRNNRKREADPSLHVSSNRLE